MTLDMALRRALGFKIILPEALEDHGVKGLIGHQLAASSPLRRPPTKVSSLSGQDSANDRSNGKSVCKAR